MTDEQIAKEAAEKIMAKRYFNNSGHIGRIRRAIEGNSSFAKEYDDYSAIILAAIKKAKEGE